MVPLSLNKGSVPLAAANSKAKSFKVECLFQQFKDKKYVGGTFERNLCMLLKYTGYICQTILTLPCKGNLYL